MAPDQVSRLIRDLDSGHFAVRQKAGRTLEALADLAEAPLRQALAKRPSLEVRRRIEALLAQLPRTRWRAVRAVAVLEHMNMPQARTCLAALAKGAPGVRLTEEARDTLERLTHIKRSVNKTNQ
jgi:hypothetical protein